MTDKPVGYTYYKETQKNIIRIKFLPSYLPYLRDVYNLNILSEVAISRILYTSLEL